jgi:hypothetical protein
MAKNILVAERNLGFAPLPVRPSLDIGLNPHVGSVFFAVLAFGLLFTVYNLYSDVTASGTPTTTWLPFLLLGGALLIAFGFEFVNGFHDTANAVATVIYTHSLPAHVAVAWSGLFNFLASWRRARVAYGIIALLPVEADRKSDQGRALRWCLRCSSVRSSGTWARGAGASASSSHHPDRLDHRRRPRQSDTVGIERQRRRLGAGEQGRLLPLSSRRSSGSSAAGLLLLSLARRPQRRASLRSPRAPSLRPRGSAAS